MLFVLYFLHNKMTRALFSQVLRLRYIATFKSLAVDSSNDDLVAGHVYLIPMRVADSRSLKIN